MLLQTQSFSDLWCRAGATDTAAIVRRGEGALTFLQRDRNHNSQLMHQRAMQLTDSFKSWARAHMLQSAAVTHLLPLLLQRLLLRARGTCGRLHACAASILPSCSPCRCRC
jgi:hypothetical protein